MKFATLALIGAVAATAIETEADVEQRLSQIIETNRLISKRDELAGQLAEIESSIANLAEAAPVEAAPAKEAAPAEAAPADAAPADAAPADETAAASSNTAAIIGGSVGGLVVVGLAVWWYMKRSSGEEAEGGNKDDQYTKFLNAELSA